MSYQMLSVITLLLLASVIQAGQYADTVGEGEKGTVSQSESRRESGEQSIVAIDTADIKPLSAVIQAVAEKKIIYVGESHDQFAHHMVQLEILKGLYTQHKKIAIGLEMFQRPFQKVLDQYIAGEISERELLKRSEYFSRWGFDYHLYKPILDFAKSAQIPVVALNIQQEIVKKVSREGIDSLSEAEKQAIPSQMDFTDTVYRERLLAVFHAHQSFEDRPFDFFYQAQILWDETMAQSIAEFLQQNPDYQMVVLAGSGHLAYGSGIPKRTFRRTGYEYVIILNDAEMERDIAHYIVFPEPVDSATSPKLMVFLGEEQEKVEIRGFPQDSVSAKAGLQIGDIIIALDGTAIRSIEDVKIDLLYRKKGDIIKIKALRKETEMEFEVTL